MLVAPHLSFLGRLLPCRASPMYLVSTPTRCRGVWPVSWRFVGVSWRKNLSPVAAKGQSSTLHRVFFLVSL